MAALGGYVRGLRERQHVSRTGLAGQLEVDATTLWRIEEGKQEPSGGLLVTLIRALRGSFDDVAALLADKSADEGKGAELADRRLAQYAVKQAELFTERVGSDRADEIARLLVADPDFVKAIRRIAERLDG